jgi:dienelactone hydrolase
MWPLNHKAGKVLLLVVVIATAAALYNPLAQLFLAGRLLLAVREVVAGDTGKNLAVRETRVQRSMGSEKLEGILYEPSQSRPRSGVLLIAGVSELGCYHPRLVAMSRTLAAKGFFVVTPDIVMFRQFKVTPAVLDEIAFWYKETRDLAASRKLERTGIAGISFSATLALIVAAQPQVRDSAGFVLGIGAYDDLRRCSRQWFSSSQAGTGEGYYPVRFYAKWILMIAALDMLHADEDRKFVQEVLLQLLLQRPVPQAPDNLTKEGRRWYRLAVMPENESDPELASEIENYLAPRLYRQLSPDRAAAEVRCPVFLVHGAYDDLIPPTESEELKKRIRGAKSYLLISPFLTHTHPLQRTLSWSEKGSAFLDMFGFFYNLAGVVR